MIIKNPTFGPISEKLYVVDEYRLFKVENVTVPAGGTLEIASLSGMGQHIYTWIYIDGASWVGSAESMLTYSIDGIALTDFVHRFMGGTAGLTGGIPESFQGIWNSAAWVISGFHAVKYFYRRSFALTFRNMDTVSATLVFFRVIVERYKQIASI